MTKFECFSDDFQHFGIGVDMTDIRRFARMQPTVLEQLAKRILTDQEYSNYSDSKDKVRFMAVSYCCKEAVSKMFGTGFRGFWFKDIQITKNDLNKPCVQLSKNLSHLFDIKAEYFKIELTVTHEIPYIICFCIGQNIIH